MSHEIVLRGGKVIDGTGAEAFPADVAIDDGRITALGSVDAPGQTEVDASGHAVTPGFVDIHTHLDAQIGWDPMMTPLTWHGVTTALLGNCGVTFAPVQPGRSKLLADMMETVEDIPSSAILGGLPWNWEGYGGYLDALEELKPAINVAGLVGHCAVRFYVMGEERAIEAQPTADELEQMAEVVGEAIDAGAAGFSTSRLLGHVLPDGRDVPGTHASHDELLRIARAVKEHGGGLMQNVLNLSGAFESELELIRKQAETTGDRVLFSLTAGRSDDSGKRLNGIIDGMRADGLDVNAVAIPRGSGFVSGLVNNLPWRHGSWARLAALDFDQRLAAVDDPATCQELIEDAKADRGGMGKVPMFWLGEDEAPNYAFGPDTELGAMAERAGEERAETWLRLTRESRGKALFTMLFFNPNLRAVADLISQGSVLPGLGDAGAHVGQVMDAGWCSFVLSHWVRDEGLFPVEEAVRRMTTAPARILGLEDRGRIAEGMRADLNVIDLERVSERMPEYVHDFPGGAGRFIQKGRGYKATLCNGQFILRDDELTTSRAGSVLR